MVDYTLQHLIYGQAVINNKPSDLPDLLAISDDLTITDLGRLIGRVPLSPLPLDGVQASQSIAMIREQINGEPVIILARAHYQYDNQILPVRQLVFINADDVARFQDLETLLVFFRTPIPTYNVTNSPLSPLTATGESVQNQDKQVTILKTLLEQYFEDDLRQLLLILDRVILKNVIIRNFPIDNEARLSLVRGLRLLLPESQRHLLTFSTHTHALSQTLPRLSFNDTLGETSATVIDWQTRNDLDSITHPYILQLQEQWQDNVIELVHLMTRYNDIAENLSFDNSTLTGILTSIASRHQLDLSAMQGGKIASEQILGVFESDVPMSVGLQTAYVILLLEANFESRDTIAAQAIASVLQENDELDQSIQPFLNTSIEQQPDAVYSFLRTHLHTLEDDAISPRWLTRLHEAAQAAVTIAIESGDATMIRSWLTLISREPLSYQLADIVSEAILAAKPFVSESSDLAQELLVVAVRRQPEMIATLLSDETVLTALSELIRTALIDHDAIAIEGLSTDSRDLFLLGLRRVIDAKQASVTSGSVRALWQYYLQQPKNTLPEIFRPTTILADLLVHPNCFSNGGIGTLLSLSLAETGHDEFFYDAVAKLSNQETLASAIAQALEQSGRSTNTVIDMVSTLLGRDAITPQIGVDTVASILANRNWGDDTMPYAEQLARLMSQHPDTDTTPGILWKLSELSATHRNETMLKVSQRRLLEATNDIVTESQVVETIKNLRRDSQWSASGKATLVRWWRTFAQDLGTGQLQKIEKLLESNRTLEDLRAIVQTTIAMRRIIGNRTLEEFSETIATTYALLQALSEGFDPNDKLVDSLTIRNELDARADELPAEQRPVLSTNLRELAQLVTVLSENRSKPSIIRSDDALERQLVTGEQEPQSAIDVMRWLSGYLDGIQKGKED